MNNCPHCRSPRAYFDNTPTDHFICGESLVTVEDADRTLACDHIKNIMEEAYDFAICHLWQNDKDPTMLCHNFTSHEEDACIFLAKHWPEEFTLVQGGVQLKESK
jgi:hypothetical protein